LASGQHILKQVFLLVTIDRVVVNMRREQTHVSCSKSPSTTTVSVSAPAQASFVISRPTVTAIGDVHMTARNLLPHMFSTRTSTVPGTMAASLGLALFYLFIYLFVFNGRLEAHEHTKHKHKD